MTQQEIVELAAILVQEHGRRAIQMAEARKAQHAHEPHSDAYRLWSRIAIAVTRRLATRVG